jgi:hypothetical protein
MTARRSGVSWPPPGPQPGHLHDDIAEQPAPAPSRGFGAGDLQWLVVVGLVVVVASVTAALLAVGFAVVVALWLWIEAER